MARLITEGFEMGNLDLWEGQQWPVGLTTTTANVRSGTYALNLYTQNYGPAGYCYKYFTESSEIYYRGSWEQGLYENTNQTVQFRKDGTSCGGLSLDTATYQFRLMSGSTLLAQSSNMFELNVRYLLEMHYKIASGSSGIFELKVDGVRWAYYEGNTLFSSASAVNNLLLKATTHGGSGESTFIDDVALNNTSGSYDNSWCGDGHIVAMRPNAEGDTLQLTPLSGSTHYLMVDEVPPDGDTTYVSGSDVDTYDLYNMTQASSLIPEYARILRVWPASSAKDAAAEGGKIKLGIKTSGSELWSDDITLSSEYDTHYGTYYLTNPVTDTEWTISDLDDSQFGAKIRGT